jgi:hypothetical protein
MMPNLNINCRNFDSTWTPVLAVLDDLLARDRRFLNLERLDLRLGGDRTLAERGLSPDLVTSLMPLATKRGILHFERMSSADGSWEGAAMDYY